MDLLNVQKAVQAFAIDGWLLYDFRGQNPLARRIIHFPADGHATRRWFYFVRARGEPKKLVHRIESGVLDHLPGEKRVYLRWQELEQGIRWLLEPAESHNANPANTASRIAMEYAPGTSNPYISCVDAGTVEFVRSLGVEVVSSGDLVQLFEATLDDEQWAMHLEAARHTNAAYSVAWNYIATQVRVRKRVTEIDVQQQIMAYFGANGLTTDHPPIVGVGPHSGDPHYAPNTQSNAEIREGDFVLIDLWAKLARPRSIYSDLTRVGFVGATVPDKYENIFQIVAAARDAGIALVRDAVANRRPLRGYQVDDACRAVIEQAGYGQYFIHRTGHNIGENTHGNGAHMDNLETHEERLVVPRTLFSIEPGIYLPEFGVRSEINVFIDAQSKVHVTGGELQQRVLGILAPGTV
jgi:Xaa-Pro aminopeptidase